MQAPIFKMKFSQETRKIKPLYHTDNPVEYIKGWAFETKYSEGYDYKNRWKRMSVGYSAYKAKFNERNVFKEWEFRGELTINQYKGLKDSLNVLK